MVPILQMVNEIALAPFKNPLKDTKDQGIYPTEDDLSYFPLLPRIRKRSCYKADNNTKADKYSMCTKNYSKHVALSPGIFTLFCPHGTCHKL